MNTVLEKASAVVVLKESGMQWRSQQLLAEAAEGVAQHPPNQDRAKQAEEEPEVGAPAELEDFRLAKFHVRGC